MTLYGKFSPFILLLLIYSCGSASVNDMDETPLDSTAQLMENVIGAHGELGNYVFTFRENGYSFEITDSTYKYTKVVRNDSTLREDALTNDAFERYENGELLNLSQEDVDRYSESLNSVIYFTCLPLNLSDPAVNRSLKPSVKIHGKSYDVMEVTFDEEGGGTDHDDVFYYWFNTETHIMDYMAYSYAVNGGGVRFRSAYNSRMIDGMRFQDYINYGAPVGTPLDSLPILLETNQLEELSRIEAEDVLSF
ncbi:MAG: hypothetical protein GQ574_24975 [Crocinitomix sp.]|nr:hypothetical protein [Crocinitomix sp.]